LVAPTVLKMAMVFFFSFKNAVNVPWIPNPAIIKIKKPPSLRKKRKSISASARQLIQKYLNKEEAGIYGNFYTIRSGLLHDGNLRCKENEFREKLSQLNDMVSRLLIEIMESKAITYERTPNT